MGVAPGVFVVLAFVVTALRTNVVVAFIGTLTCAAIAALLCLVNPPDPNEANLLGQNEQTPDEKARAYLFGRD